MILIKEVKGRSIAHVEEDVTISSVSDMLDIIGNAQYQDAYVIISKKEQFHSDFFDLSSKLAGDILQKISNYNMRLIITGDFNNITSKSLRDLIYESNYMKRVVFVSEGEVEEYL